MQFDEVKAEHFYALSQAPFPHVLIESAMKNLGGGGVEGGKFWRDSLYAAGWQHASLVQFSKHPEEAVSALNKIRLVIMSTTDPLQILEDLKK